MRRNLNEREMKLLLGLMASGRLQEPPFLLEEVQVEYQQTKNFTTCFLEHVVDEDDQIRKIGVTKRNPNTDKENPVVAEQVALVRAMRAVPLDSQQP